MTQSLPPSSTKSAIFPSAPEQAPVNGSFLWRPSRVCARLLWVLALLAPLSVLASELPAALAWPLALLAGVLGARSARISLRVPARHLVISGPERAASCEGAPMDELRLRWRGPLAFLDWGSPAGGPRQRLVFWPDVLDAAARRELRLAVRRYEAASGKPSVAG